MAVHKCSDTELLRCFSNRTIYSLYNFINTSALKLIFFSKCSKCEIDFRNAEKNWENIFHFRVKCIWIAAYNFWNTSAMELIHFSKSSKFDLNFRNPEKMWENIFNFGDNFIWIGCIKHPLLRRENTCHREPIYWQTVSRFQILMKKNFSNWSSFRVIKSNNKTTAVQI